MGKTHWRREQVLRIIGMDASRVRADAAACDGHQLGVDERPPMLDGLGVDCTACTVLRDAALEGRSHDVLRLMNDTIEAELRAAASEYLDAHRVSPEMSRAAEAGFYLGRLCVEVGKRREAELAAAQLRQSLWRARDELARLRRSAEEQGVSP